MPCHEHKRPKFANLVKKESCLFLNLGEQLSLTLLKLERTRVQANILHVLATKAQAHRPYIPVEALAYVFTAKAIRRGQAKENIRCINVEWSYTQTQKPTCTHIHTHKHTYTRKHRDLVAALYLAIGQ